MDGTARGALWRAPMYAPFCEREPISPFHNLKATNVRWSRSPGFFPFERRAFLHHYVFKIIHFRDY